MKAIIILTVLIILSFFQLFSQDKPILKSWHEINTTCLSTFGVYSELGGVWNGRPNDNGYSEQIQARAGIFADVYQEIPSRFNPAKWNAGSIVSLAKKAGMLPIVITSKHHDGFCIFKTGISGEYKVRPENIIKGNVISRNLSNALKHYSYSFIDYYNNYHSNVKQEWNFLKTAKHVVPAIFFTEGEIGKRIDLSWNGTDELVKLQNGSEIQLNTSQIQCGKRFSYGSFQSSFEEVPEKISSEINTSTDWTKRSNLSWKEASDWKDGEVFSKESKPLQSWFVLQEICSETAQKQLVEISSGEGVIVWING